MPTLEFKPFPKMARLSRECIITEKIDGTNASIFICKNHLDHDVRSIVALHSDNSLYHLIPGSRTRWISPENDNFGFAQWVWDNAQELVELGEGHHFGEWWGSGIQRSYGFKNGERFFSLFNAGRWVEHDQPISPIENPNPKAEQKFTERAPACCKVVPILLQGDFKTYNFNFALNRLQDSGSLAAEGFMNPEGVVVYHLAGNVGFKKTLENDHQPKSHANA
jgi:hypothetical protein